MSYPQQPGNWSDPSWPSQPPGYDPKSPYADPSAAPTSGQQPGYPASGYPAPGYGGYPGYGYPPAAPTNGLAIAALVCSIAGVATCITAPVGAILGHVARRQIRERGEQGEGMAMAGIIVGWIITGLMLLAIAFYVVVIIWAINADSTYDDTGYVLQYLSALVG